MASGPSGVGRRRCLRCFSSIIGAGGGERLPRPNAGLAHDERSYFEELSGNAVGDLARRTPPSLLCMSFAALSFDEHTQSS